MNNVLFQSNSDEWETPIDLFNILNKEFQFNLDPCATDENHKCNKYYTKEENGLKPSWGGLQCFVTHHIQKLKNG